MSLVFAFWLLLSMRDLSSQTRDRTPAPCGGSSEPYPLDCQGIPHHVPYTIHGNLSARTHILPKHAFSSVLFTKNSMKHRRCLSRFAEWRNENEIILEPQFWQRDRNSTVLNKNNSKTGVWILKSVWEHILISRNGCSKSGHLPKKHTWRPFSKGQP